MRRSQPQRAAGLDFDGTVFGLVREGARVRDNFSLICGKAENGGKKEIFPWFFHVSSFGLVVILAFSGIGSYFFVFPPTRLSSTPFGA